LPLLRRIVFFKISVVKWQIADLNDVKVKTTTYNDKYLSNSPMPESETFFERTSIAVYGAAIIQAL